jgi:hypothetical protein
MTEKQIFVTMLQRAGVEHTEETLPTESRIIIETYKGPSEESKNKGHFGFWTEFVFTPQGELTHVGIWE